MKKAIYIDVMEKVLSAYTEEHIRAYTRKVEEKGIEEHGYPRLVSNIGILVANGRKPEYKDMFREMMDLCCREIPVAFTKNGFQAGNDFSVKEVVFCLLEVEKSGIFDKSVTDAWRCDLAKIDPYTTYSMIAPTPVEPVHNWAAFGAASEQLRKYAGIGDASAFIENQVKSQLFSFEESGMYRDPDEPMVYDLTARLQLSAAYYFGFDGESRDTLGKHLINSADITLDMQSVTGEVPFGGRSNQFLHNEAVFAALSEFYASTFKKLGDMKKAGMFKNAARLAVESILPWLSEDRICHIKNRYARDSKFGCEGYAYFDKYMVTTGSFIYMAYAMADDDIEEIPCPAMTKNSICVTSENFHKVMCRYNDYFAQFDTKADPNYDSSGLGRIHKAGAPSALCLSVPFCKKPHYGLDIENPTHFSICVAQETENGFASTADPATEYRLLEKTVADEFVRVEFECKAENGMCIRETCTLSDSGVEITAKGADEIQILFPMFVFDGETNTEISLSETCGTVLYKGYRCNYSTDGTLLDKKEVYANRNGHYNAVAAVGKESVSLKIEIVKA